jgi:hypothetical protein
MVEKTKKVPAPELFKIHSMVRDVSTRLHRAKAPKRHRFNLLLGGGLVRVVRKRATTVTKSTLQRLLPELLKKEEQGMLKVTDMIGRRIDLNTFQVVEEAPPEEVLPHPPLDTAATDHAYPVGQQMPNVEGGVPAAQELDTPEALRRELPEGEDDEEEVLTELPEGTDDDNETPKSEAQPKPRKRGRRR